MTDSKLKIYYDNEIDANFILNKKVAIIGYGSQGHAHAQNLKDSGVDVKVGLRAGSETALRVEDAGLECMTIEAATQWADVLILLLPDTAHGTVYKNLIEPNLTPGMYLGFAHGFSILYKEIEPPANINTFIVAPKGPGHLVRSEYRRGIGVPSLVAVGQDPSGDTLEVSLAYAKCNGGGRAGVIQTTFKDETETDLFGEQAILCGGASALIKAGFETLVEAGYPPEMAYFECCHELKLIVDLIYQGGLKDMRYSISDTARYGDVSRGPRVITEDSKKAMKQILEEIQSGQFAKEWIEENKNGQPNMKRMVEEDNHHALEVTGQSLRKMMSWQEDSNLISANER